MVKSLRTTLAAIAVAGVAAGTASAGAFVVDPGPVVAGRTIVGSGQNLPPMDWRTYNVGPGPFAQVSYYYEGGTYARDRDDVVSSARQWINGRLRSLCGGVTPATLRKCRVAVAFDIDDTLLSAWTYSRSTNPPLTWSSSTWTAYVESCGYTPNTTVINLLNGLRARGVHVAIISAGSASTRAYSEACLRQNGVKGWSSITYRGPEDAALQFAVFKARARSAVEKKGYRIIASIGDQVSDMSWGHTERGFLLPNLMSYLN